jgi:hypothetical protein
MGKITSIKLNGLSQDPDSKQEPECHQTRCSLVALFFFGASERA